LIFILHKEYLQITLIGRINKECKLEKLQHEALQNTGYTNQVRVFLEKPIIKNIQAK